MKRFCLGIIVALGLTLPAAAQGVDPLIGTWKINLEKSTSNLPLDKSQTNTYAVDGQNIALTVEGMDAKGESYKVTYKHIYDGQPHPTTGNPNYDSSAYTRIGNTINWVRFRQGKTAEVGQAVIVPGKTFTLTVEGINANNQSYHEVRVLDRQ
jgi:hypothetical protein